MKATKLMALGLVGLTTLGLAATANAADSSDVTTQASITFSTGNESGNQDGPDGEVSPENPIDETPEAVNGWKLGVPSVLKFVGTAEDGTLVESGDGVKQSIYNADKLNNNYESEGIKNADGTRTPFFLRFEVDGEEAPQSANFSVKVARDQFKVNGLLLDVDKSSSITFPEFTTIAEKSAVIKTLTSTEAALTAPNTPVTTISALTLSQQGINDTVGFANVGANNAIKLHIGTQSSMLKALPKATVSTTLTWTFIAQ